MTWQWVVLILGIFVLITIFFGFTAWIQMKMKINERYPKTLAEMIAIAREKKEEVPREEDTIVQPKWPEGFTKDG